MREGDEFQRWRMDAKISLELNIQYPSFKYQGRTVAARALPVRAQSSGAEQRVASQRTYEEMCLREQENTNFREKSQGVTPPWPPSRGEFLKGCFHLISPLRGEKGGHSGFGLQIQE